MIGKRVETHEEFWEAGPGAYMKITVSQAEDSEDTPPQQGWLMADPNGHPHHIGGDLTGHVVEENDDGTVTVRPNPPSDPNNSNSILCVSPPGCGWHGYIYNGEWKSV